MAITKITAIVTPPATPSGIATEAEWRRRERRYGIVLPEDYMELCRVYGTGSFILPTGSRIGLINFFDKRLSRTIKVNQMGSDRIKSLRPELFTEDQAIALWAAGFDYVSFCFVLSRRSSFRILVCSNSADEFRLFDCSLEDFLFGVFSRRLKLGLVDELEFRGPISFKPVSA